MFKSAGRICVGVSLFLIRIYRFVDRSAVFGPHACRFTPSCSVYCEESLRRYGFIRGGARGILRILRCNPFNPFWGSDPVERQF